MPDDKTTVTVEEPIDPTADPIKPPPVDFSKLSKFDQVMALVSGTLAVGGAIFVFMWGRWTLVWNFITRKKAK